MCVGHASVHSDSGSRAWGSGGCARCVEQQQQRRPPCMGSGSGGCARCVERNEAVTPPSIAIEAPVCLGVRRVCAFVVHSRWRGERGAGP